MCCIHISFQFFCCQLFLFLFHFQLICTISTFVLKVHEIFPFFRIFLSLSISFSLSLSFSLSRAIVTCVLFSHSSCPIMNDIFTLLSPFTLAQRELYIVHYKMVFEIQFSRMFPSTYQWLEQIEELHWIYKYRVIGCEFLVKLFLYVICYSMLSVALYQLCSLVWWWWRWR